MNVIRYLVPSRGRPANVGRLWRAWQETEAEAELVVLIDEDDPDRQEYEHMHKLADRGYSLITSPPLGNLAAILNQWGPLLAGKVPDGREADAFGFMGDDHVPRSPRWDAELYAAAVIPNGIAYGDDLLQRSNLPTAVLMDAEIVRKLGWLVPPGIKHMYIDNWWRDLGNALGTLRYVDHVVIEHMHPVAGKAEKDEGYRRTNTDRMYTEDEAAYRAFIDRGGLTEAVEMLRD